MQVGTVMGLFGRPARPACRCRSRGQPVQGHLRHPLASADGDLLVLTDNGFGAKAQLARRHALPPASSPHGFRRSGTIERSATTFLLRPRQEGAVPHRQRGAPRSRYLTGADFDPEIDPDRSAARSGSARSSGPI
jgi:hypothetical protein